MLGSINFNTFKNALNHFEASTGLLQKQTFKIDPNSCDPSVNTFTAEAPLVYRVIAIAGFCLFIHNGAQLLYIGLKEDRAAEQERRKLSPLIERKITVLCLSALAAMASSGIALSSSLPIYNNKASYACRDVLMLASFTYSIIVCRHLFTSK